MYSQIYAEIDKSVFTSDFRSSLCLFISTPPTIASISPSKHDTNPTARKIFHFFATVNKAPNPTKRKSKNIYDATA